MSWSFSTVVEAGHGETGSTGQLEAAMLEAQRQAGEWGLQTRHQAQAAVNAAIMLASSGALGTGSVDVTCYGHANPDHHDPESGPEDSITVRVNRLTSPPQS